MEEELQQKLKNLPQNLQDAIFSEDVANKIMAIGKKYSLAIDGIGDLNDETMNVIAGITHPRDYVSRLSKRLEVGADTAKNIAGDVNEQIFAPLRESLKSIHDIKETGTASQPTQPPAIKSPFEQKLEEKVFIPPLKTEVERAQKENRYPDKADPYREPPK